MFDCGDREEARLLTLYGLFDFEAIMVPFVMGFEPEVTSFLAGQASDTTTDSCRAF